MAQAARLCLLWQQAGSLLHGSVAQAASLCFLQQQAGRLLYEEERTRS